MKPMKPLALLLAFALMTLPALAANPPPSSGGPDASAARYRWISGPYATYHPMAHSDVPGSCLAGDLTCTPGGLADDDESGCLPAPATFSFNYFGAPVSCIRVNSNGYLKFGGPSNAGPPRQLPSTGNPTGIVAAFWGDLVPCDGRILYQFNFKELTVEYQQVRVRTPGSGDLVCQQDPVTFLVKLRLNDVIELEYPNVSTKAAVSTPTTIGAAPTPRALLNLGDSVASIGMTDDKGGHGFSYAFGSIEYSAWRLHIYPNRAPFVVLQQQSYVLEDEVRTGLIEVYDADGDSVTITGMSMPLGGLKFQQGTVPAGGTLGNYTFFPSQDQFGWSPLSVQGSDALGKPAVGVGGLFILPVNDPPTIVPGGDVAVWRHGGPQSLAWASGISAGPANENQTLAIHVAADDPTLFATQPRLALDGTLTFEPSGAKGATLVHVVLKDTDGSQNGGVDTTRVSFTVTFGSRA